jgi:WD40 repeat protein
MTRETTPPVKRRGMHPMRLLAFITAMLTAVLALASPDIAIINLDTGNVTHLPNSMWRQVVVQTDQAAQTFTTMLRDDPDFVLRTFNAQGELQKTTRIPKFSDGYAGSKKYALSPDGRKMVFGRDTALYLLDIPAKTATMLWEKTATQHGSEIHGLYWISDDDVAALIGSDDGEIENVVTLVDLSSGTRKTLYRPAEFGSDSAITPDHRVLAFQDGSIDGKIKVLDLQTGKLVATLGAGTELLGAMQWSPDGAELAFEEGRKIYVWNRATDRLRLLKALDKKFLLHCLVFTHGQVGFVGDYAEKKWVNPLSKAYGQQRLVLLHATPGKEIRTISQQFNGRLFYLHASHSIVAEVGH